ncbi:MAG: YicC/YloC family endoribonuclease [Pseudomonadota bacterium]
MIFSMTGYAARKQVLEHGALHIEIKSVNARYLDVQFRLGDELRASELVLRELIAGHIARGKVECRLLFIAAPSTPSGAEAANVSNVLNLELLHQLKALTQQVHAVLPQAQSLSVHEVLRWPGLLAEAVVDADALHPLCLSLAEQALDDFNASRAREGDKLARVILECLARMRALVAEVKPHLPRAQAAFQEKLRQRLLDALGQADDERIRQEVVVFALRIDVAEELARLSTHLDEVERVLTPLPTQSAKAAKASVGKRLDFLMQELNREANTLASKSVLSEVAQAALEMKLLIEQMREQIQNLE